MRSPATRTTCSESDPGSFRAYGERCINSREIGPALRDRTLSQVERFPERQRKDHSELVEEATAPNAAPHVLKLNGEAAAIAKRKARSCHGRIGPA